MHSSRVRLVLPVLLALRGAIAAACGFVNCKDRVQSRALFVPMVPSTRVAGSGSAFVHARPLGLRQFCVGMHQDVACRNPTVHRHSVDPATESAMWPTIYSIATNPAFQIGVLVVGFAVIGFVAGMQVGTASTAATGGAAATGMAPKAIVANPVAAVPEQAASIVPEQAASMANAVAGVPEQAASMANAVAGVPEQAASLMTKVPAAPEQAASLMTKVPGAPEQAASLMTKVPAAAEPVASVATKLLSQAESLPHAAAVMSMAVPAAPIIVGAAMISWYMGHSAGTEKSAKYLRQCNPDTAPSHAPGMAPPYWLRTKGCFNFAICGDSGVGKSTLINALRKLRPGDHGAAQVGVAETTSDHHCYKYSVRAPADGGETITQLEKIRIWDLPGAGTPMHPLKTYVESEGLRHMDAVLIVTAGRFTEVDLHIYKDLKKHNVPVFLVRNKVDQDIENNKRDYKRSPEDTLAEIRKDLEDHLDKGDVVYCLAAALYVQAVKDKEKLPKDNEEYATVENFDLLVDNMMKRMAAARPMASNGAI